MADGASFDSLNAEAIERGYKITFNKETGKPRVVPPATGRSPEFERRLKANSAIVKSHFTTPASIRDKVKDAHREGWLESVNSYINHIRDVAIKPAAGFAGEVVNAPASLAAGLINPKAGQEIRQEGKSVGQEAAGMAIPDSMTGKMINLSMLAQPETVLGRLAVPTLVGGATGAISGEGGLSGAGQGLFAAGMGELPTAAQVPGKVSRYLRRGTLAKELYDDVVPGQKISPILKLKSFDTMLKKGENWVRALRSGTVGTEAGQRFAGSMDDLRESVLQYSLEKAKSIQRKFMDQFKVPFNKAGKANREIGGRLFEEYKQARQEAAEALAEGRQIVNAMKQTKRMRSQIFGPAGKMKQGPTAVTARDTLNQTTSAIRQKLKSMNPAFGDTFDAINDEYALFGSLRDLADNPKAITQDGKHVNLDTIMRQMDEAPRRLEGRLKDEWENVKSLMRRDAPTSEGFDQPGMMARFRTHMYGTHGRIASSLSDIGETLAGAPIVSKPVGKVPGLLPKQPKLQPGVIPRLITGGAANEAVDSEVRGATP